MATVKKANKGELVFKLFADMKKRNIKPNSKTCSLVINEYESCGMWKRLLVEAETMKKMGVNLKRQHYNAMLFACSQVYPIPVSEVLNLLDEMKGKQIAPSKISYANAIRALKNARRWSKVLEMFEEMQEKGLVPDDSIYFSAIKAYVRDKNFTKAVSLFEDMRIKGVSPSVKTYNLAILAHEKLGQWSSAVNLTKIMKENGSRHDVFSYAAAISACTHEDEFEEATNLLDMMKTK